PAAMVSTFQRFQHVKPGGETVFIPHVGTAKLPLNWERIAHRAGVRYISPAGESEEVILALARAKLVLAESLHGAIIADAFRVPFVPVSISPTFNRHKWLDWSESLNLDIQFEEFLLGMKQVRNRLNQARKKLSVKKAVSTSAPDTSDTNGTRVADVVSQDEKVQARKWVSRLEPAVEMMLIRDLKRATQSQGFLSDDKILRARQEEIANRVQEMRERLAA
ncbi:MAG: polysaccharide pyruvyl transferase family protein, partial [Pseudomonadota bacterium]